MIRIIILLLLPILAEATTVVPYPDLQSLKDVSTRVVYVRSLANNLVSIQDIFKDKSVVEPIFEVRRYVEDGAVVFGDVNLETGKSYLLFLDSRDKPICLSFYVYESIGDLLVPIESSKSINVINRVMHGPVPKDSLFMALRGLSPYPKVIDLEDNGRAAPSHCTFLIAGGKPLRSVLRTNFVLFCDTLTSFCPGTTYGQLVGASVDSINVNYKGLDYTNQQFTPYNEDCTDDLSVIGSEYRDYMDMFHDIRTCFVFFEDPCSEIADLSGCFGTLAIGGAYGIGTHVYDGQTWINAVYPFIVMNNALAGCHCGNISSVIIHELGHTLGFGHTASSFGPANMNPSCCNDITDLDRECFDYVYPYCSVDNVWQGGISNSWFDAGNWTMGVPDSCHNVFIEATDSVIIPPIMAEARAGALQVDSSAILQIDSLSYLNVSRS